MANFCTNCGSKLNKNDNFCSNCGTRIEKSYIEQNYHSPNQNTVNIEKRKAKQKLNTILGGVLSFGNAFKKTLDYYGLDYAKTRKAIRLQVEKEIDSGQITSGGVEYRVNQLIVEYKTKMDKEKEEKRKKLKMIDEILESEEIKSEIRKNNIGQKYLSSIKDNLQNKIIYRKENMNEDKIKDYIKTELKKERDAQEKRKREEQERARKLEEEAKIRKEQEMIRKEMIENGEAGYCGFGCRYFYEEFLDDHGGIVGDFDSGGIVDYYCGLGHSAYPGKFCEYYNK
ncbi:zinc-ribbon domain-containing protein [Methanobrevibacter sp.]|uniref:zinc-ribbon domain-containing protein n=1 Tax=Methanobrevibacter sp. TaxID=66852 RepID=UPI003864F95E